VAITRTPIVDDDGSGTTGTVIDNAWKQELYNQIDGLGTVQAYSVAWSCASGPAPVVGNGTLTGRYLRVGTFVWVNIHLAFGSTTTGGTGGWLFSLPLSTRWTGGTGVTASGIALIGSAYAVVGAYMAAANLINPFAGGVGIAGVGMDAIRPATWGVNSVLDYHVVYEAA
jgi:hypothetical protein